MPEILDLLRRGKPHPALAIFLLGILVMITPYHMNVAMELPTIEFRMLSVAKSKITKMPHDIMRAHHGIPVGDKRCVHFCHRREWTLGMLTNLVMAEVGVGGEEETGH